MCLAQLLASIFFRRTNGISLNSTLNSSLGQFMCKMSLWQYLYTLCNSQPLATPPPIFLNVAAKGLLIFLVQGSFWSLDPGLSLNDFDLGRSDGLSRTARKTGMNLDTMCQWEEYIIRSHIPYAGAPDVQEPWRSRGRAYSASVL